MSNSANFRQNAEQTQALNKLNSLMSTHSTSQNSTNVSVDALKALQTKTFTPSVAPIETITGATEKQFSMLGGVNHMGGSFNKLNPVKVNDSGELSEADVSTATLQAVANGHLNTIATASADPSTATLQGTANGHLATIAGNSADPSTATLQGTANGLLTTISTNTELKGFTDITNSASAVRLNCEATGKLQVQVVGSDSINGTTPHRHLVVDSNGRLNVVTHYGSTLANNTSRVRVSNHITNFGALATNTAGVTYDLGADYYKYKVLRFALDMVATTPLAFYVQQSDDGSAWSWVTGIVFLPLGGGGVTTNIANTHIDQPLRYWRFYNNDSSSPTNTIDNVWAVASTQ